jgi:hypothetical protein
MTFSILTGAKSVTGSIKSWQNYAQIDSEGVLTDAEAMIFQRLRVREMRASENLTVKVGASSVDLPDGFLDPLKLRDITNDCNLGMLSEEQLEDMRTWTDAVLDSGDPSVFGIYDEALQFDCKTTTQWRARLIFYRKPDALSTSNETNWMCTRYPHVLRMACLAVAARFAHDSEMHQREQSLLFAEIDNLNALDEQSRRGQEN